MRSLGWLAFVFALVLAVPPVFAAGASPLGRWEITTGEARYSVSGCGGMLCAKLVWLRDDARTEENLALLNHYLVRGARPQGAGGRAGRGSRREEISIRASPSVVPLKWKTRDNCHLLREFRFSMPFASRRTLRRIPDFASNGKTTF